MHPEKPRMPKPRTAIPLTAEAKARFRWIKKQEKKFPVDKALFAKYRDKPPTLENMHALIKESFSSRASGVGATVNYFIWHLTKSPAERKFIKKARRAYWQYRADSKQGFARGLIESIARKQRKTRAEAKEMLLQDLDKLIGKIDRNATQMMSVAQRLEALAEHPQEAALVRHTGGQDIKQNIIVPLTTLKEAVEKL